VNRGCSGSLFLAGRCPSPIPIAQPGAVRCLEQARKTRRGHGRKRKRPASLGQAAKPGRSHAPCLLAALPVLSLRPCARCVRSSDRADYVARSYSFHSFSRLEYPVPLLRSPRSFARGPSTPISCRLPLLHDVFLTAPGSTFVWETANFSHHTTAVAVASALLDEPPLHVHTPRYSSHSPLNLSLSITIPFSIVPASTSFRTIWTGFYFRQGATVRVSNTTIDSLRIPRFGRAAPGLLCDIA
jgi:hypothetical protein